MSVQHLVPIRFLQNRLTVLTLLLHARHAALQKPSKPAGLVIPVILNPLTHVWQNVIHHLRIGVPFIKVATQTAVPTAPSSPVIHAAAARGVAVEMTVLPTAAPAVIPHMKYGMPAITENRYMTIQGLIWQTA